MKEELKEIYKYCKDKGYEGSEDEFYKEIKEVIVEMIGEEELKKVAGGKAKISKKFVAGMLASLALGSNVGAASVETDERKQGLLKDSSVGEKNDSKEKLKKILIEAGTVLGGGTMIGVIGAIISKGSGQKDSTNANAGNDGAENPEKETKKEDNQEKQKFADDKCNQKNEKQKIKKGEETDRRDAENQLILSPTANQINNETRAKAEKLFNDKKVPDGGVISFMDDKNVYLYWKDETSGIIKQVSRPRMTEEAVTEMRDEFEKIEHNFKDDLFELARSIESKSDYHAKTREFEFQIRRKMEKYKQLVPNLSEKWKNPFGIINAALEVASELSTKGGSDSGSSSGSGGDSMLDHAKIDFNFLMEDYPNNPPSAFDLRLEAPINQMYGRPSGRYDISTSRSICRFINSMVYYPEIFDGWNKDTKLADLTTASLTAEDALKLIYPDTKSYLSSLSNAVSSATSWVKSWWWS